MARNGDVNVAAKTWVQLTNANANSARVQASKATAIRLQATNGTTAPTSLAGSVKVDLGAMLTADLLFSSLWPGVSGANRLWAFCEIDEVLSVSHADA